MQDNDRETVIDAVVDLNGSNSVLQNSCMSPKPTFNNVQQLAELQSVSDNSNLGGGGAYQTRNVSKNPTIVKDSDSIVHQNIQGASGNTNLLSAD